MNYVDGMICETATPSEELVGYFQELGKPILGWQDKATPAYLDQYEAFYRKIVSNE